LYWIVCGEKGSPFRFATMLSRPSLSFTHLLPTSRHVPQKSCFSMTNASSFQRPAALVIDDERAVRWTIRQALEPDVCTVLEAADGETGLRMIARGTPRIHLALVDLMLPNFNGLEVIEALCRSHPELPLLCITGFGATATELLESTLRDYRVPVLLKPFRGEELAEAVQALLERANRRTRPRARSGQRGLGRPSPS
jgi:DNA-binding response OmpR family regulator